MRICTVIIILFLLCLCASGIIPWQKCLVQQFSFELNFRAYRDRQQKTEVGILAYLRAPLSVAKILENLRKHAYSWSFGMGLVCVQLLFFCVASLKAGKHAFQKVNLACARILSSKVIHLARLPSVYCLFQGNNEETKTNMPIVSDNLLS